jgi:zinc transporter
MNRIEQQSSPEDTRDAIDNGLVTAWLLDGNGGGESIGWDRIAHWRPADGLLWIHLDYTHENSSRWLAQEGAISGIVQSVLTSDESRPRCEKFANGLLAIFRGVNLNPDANPEDMVSIRIWLDESRIISCRRRKLASIADMKQALTQKTGPRNQGEFLAQLSEYLVNRMDVVIENLEQETIALEEQLTMNQTHQLRSRLSDNRRTVINLRRYLAPQRDALRRMQNIQVDWMEQQERTRLNESAEQTQRYLEGLDAVRDQTQVTQEELTQKLTEQTEKRMYLLAIVTSIFLPLGFLTGILGINVGGIPGTDNPLAFWLVCLLAFFIGLISLWLLHLKKWF